MTGSELQCNNILIDYFFKEFVYRDLYFYKGKQKQELCDGLVEFQDAYVVFQIKEKRKSTAQDWLQKKVYKKAVHQIKETIAMLQDGNVIVVKEDTMSRDELCSIGVTFVEDEKYTLSRYDVSEQELFFKAWNETFEDTPLINDEQFKKKSWTDMLSDASKLKLKIIDKLTQEYVGEVVLMKFDTEMPEIGIQLLKKYHSQGIGTRVVNLFVNRLKSIMQVKFFTVRIRSDNYISQRMFEKMGAIKVGEEGKEYAELMLELMRNMGKEKFEKAIEKEFESTQTYTLCYKLPVV